MGDGVSGDERGGLEQRLAEASSMVVPTDDEDMKAPPWKVDRTGDQAVVMPSGRTADCNVWGVTTDRGDPRHEYDLFEDPPEWAVRLIVAAPGHLKLLREATLAIGAARRALELVEQYETSSQYDRTAGKAPHYDIVMAAIRTAKVRLEGK